MNVSSPTAASHKKKNTSASIEKTAPGPSVVMCGLTACLACAAGWWKGGGGGGSVRSDRPLEAQHPHPPLSPAIGVVIPGVTYNMTD